MAETLFGLIMVLVSTGSLSVATADHLEVRTMSAGALGCNLAWGIIDAGLYLMARLPERGRKFLLLRAVHKAPDLKTARSIIADALPPLVTSVLTSVQLESMRQTLSQVPGSAAPAQGNEARLVRRARYLSALSTFPVAIPFMIISDVRLALRVSNAVAIVMLFLCGYLFGQRAGIRPWAAGLSMVAIGIGLVGITIRLGG